MNTILSKQQIAQIQSLAKANKSIVAVYLFGSQAKGSATKKSDIDLGFLCVNKKRIDLAGLSIAIDKILKPQPADVNVVDLATSPLLLSQLIGGRVLYQSSVTARARLETEIVKLYEDYLHFRAINNYYLDKSFKEGVYATR